MKSFRFHDLGEFNGSLDGTNFCAGRLLAKLLAWSLRRSSLISKCTQ